MVASGLGIDLPLLPGRPGGPRPIDRGTSYREAFQRGPRRSGFYDCTDLQALAQDCQMGDYSPCTCAASDSCNWSGDGDCDIFCVLTLPEDHFNDEADCRCDVPENVAKQCQQEAMTPCTCAVADPCSWVGDGDCDTPKCNELFPGEQNFDDTAVDCQE